MHAYRMRTTKATMTMITDVDVAEAMREAEEMFRSRDYVRAQAVLMSILKTDPTHGDANHLLALTLYRRGLYSEAELVFRWLVDGDPSDADATQGLGVALDKLGRVDEAIASLERALSLRPDLPGASRKLNVLRARSDHPPQHWCVLRDSSIHHTGDQP